MIRVQNDPFGRALHNMLHERLLAFCQRYTPEVLAEPIVSGWLSRLYKDDQDLHILVNVDSSWAIVEHAVIEVTGPQNNRIVMCHQVQRNKANIGTFEEGIEYIDKLVQYSNAMCSIIFVERHTKALEKYGYKVSRVAMVKTILDSGQNMEDIGE